MDKAVYFSENGIFAEDDLLILSRVKEDEYDNYMEAFSVHRDILGDKYESFAEKQWNRCLNEEVFTVTVRRKIDNEFCGYCDVRDTDGEMEIGIQLLDRFQRQGIGYRALNILMDKYAELNGNTYFISRVDSKNHASQRLMEKLGGIPDGIAALVVPDEKLNWALEEALLGLVDDNIKAAAEKFGVEARKMLSHVLKYRIDVKKT